jgi:hypothetical protein
MAKATQTMAKNNKGFITATCTRQLLSFRENRFMYRCNQLCKIMNLNQSWGAHIDTGMNSLHSITSPIKQDFWDASNEDVQDIPLKIVHNTTCPFRNPSCTQSPGQQFLDGTLESAPPSLSVASHGTAARFLLR